MWEKIFGSDMTSYIDVRPRPTVQIPDLEGECRWVCLSSVIHPRSGRLSLAC